jgi:uncharacterized protein YggE
MTSNSRLMLQFAAATGIAAMLWVAAPAMAADSPANGNSTGVSTMAAPSVTARHASFNRHASRRARLAASHYRRGYERISPVRSNVECSGVWCGRQFVLMIGIGY